MNRRKFISGSASAGLLAGGDFGWLGGARAQPQNVRLVGYLDGVWGHLNSAVGHGLTEEDNKGIKVEWGGFSGKRSDFPGEQMAKYAAELVKRGVVLILAFSTKAADRKSTRL